MFYSVHAPMGILISQKTSSLCLVFLLAFISHFLLDIIPHGDIKIEEWENKKNPKKRFLGILLTDGIISLAIILILFLKLKPQNPWLFLAGIFGSALPDLFWIPLKFRTIKILEKYRRLHSQFHQILVVKMPIWAGLLLQIITANVIVYLILQK